MSGRVKYCIFICLLLVFASLAVCVSCSRGGSSKNDDKKTNNFGLDMSFVDKTFLPIILEWLEYKKEKKHIEQINILMIVKVDKKNY